MGSDPCAQPRFKLVAKGNIELQTASEQSGMIKEEFERKMEEEGYRLPR